jgi:hypothetical protein
MIGIVFSGYRTAGVILLDIIKLYIEVNIHSSGKMFIMATFCTVVVRWSRWSRWSRWLSLLSTMASHSTDVWGCHSEAVAVSAEEYPLTELAVRFESYERNFPLLDILVRHAPH